MKPITLLFSDLHTLKYIVNATIINQYKPTTIVHFLEGGYINLVEKNNSIFMDVFIPTKQSSYRFCNFVCNLTLSHTFKTLRSVERVYGPYEYVHNNHCIHKQLLDMTRVDKDYIVNIMYNLLYENFATVITDNDTLFDSCIHRNVINSIKKYRQTMRFHKKKLLRFWKIWMEHWLNPDNPNGYVKRFRNNYYQRLTTRFI